MGQPRAFHYAAAIALLVPTPAFPNATDTLNSGVNLVEACRDRNLALRLSCAAYIAGVVDGIRGASITDGKDTSVCLPRGYRNKDVQRAILAYLERRPGKLHLPAGPLVYVAATASFPCAPK